MRPTVTTFRLNPLCDFPDKVPPSMRRRAAVRAICNERGVFAENLRETLSGFFRRRSNGE